VFARIVGAAFKQLPLTKRERRELDRLMEALRFKGRLPGPPALAAPGRLGQFVLVTFKLPEEQARGKIHKSIFKQFRAAVGELLERSFGEGFILGYRFGPHRSQERGRHLHMLLSLLRFPTDLQPQAKVFLTLDDDEKSKLLPGFFIGPHLDAHSIHHVLEQPYRELLQGTFGKLGDGSDTFVHVRPGEDDFQSHADRRSTNYYVSGPWNHFDNFSVVGFYAGHTGQEVLLSSRHKTGRRRMSLEEFVREYVLHRAEKWMRRGSKGFLHGRHHLAKVLDFASEQSHPLDAGRSYLDQTPAKLQQRAFQIIAEHGDTFVTGSRPIRKPIQAEHRAMTPLFPREQLGTLLAEWPFLTLRLVVPEEFWDGGFIPHRFENAASHIDDILSRHLEKEGRKIGFVITPDLLANGRDHPGVLCLRVFLSRVCFLARDFEILAGFSSLPEGEQEEFVAAFYRHPPLALDTSMLKALADDWIAYVAQVIDPHPSGAHTYVQIADDALSIGGACDQAKDFWENSVREQVAAIDIFENDEQWYYRLPNGDLSEAYSNRKSVRRYLNRLIKVPQPEPRRFFHNQSKTIGHIAKFAVGRDIAELRQAGIKTLQLLCDRLGVDPATYKPRTITDLVGNAAKARKVATG